MKARAVLIAYDVGHGDHLLLRLEDGDVRFHAVIDCHWPAPGDPPALADLKAWGVETLDLLALTHPHKDHFLGLARIAEHFTTPPARLLRYADPGLDLRQVADLSLTHGSPAHTELYRLWELTAGSREPHAPVHRPMRGAQPEVSPTPRGRLRVVAPSREAWLAQSERLAAGAPARPNRLSSVQLWRLVDVALLLGGDLEHTDWQEALDRCRASGVDLAVDMIKVGHHGASNALAAGLVEAVRRPDRGNHAVISTPGTHHHPSPATLGALVEAGLRPRCTRFGPVCADLVAARRTAALQLGLRPKRAAARQSAAHGIGMHPVSDERCFGTVRVELEEGGARQVVPARAGARCRLFETRRGADDDGVVDPTP